MASLTALVEKMSMATQSWANEFPPEASMAAQPWANEFPAEWGCADTALEAAQMQGARFSETQVDNMFQSLQDVLDVESDKESAAPTEAGDETKAAKKAKKTRAKAARNQRFEDGKAKVIAKIGKF